MSELRDVRLREDGSCEILVAIHGGGAEQWEPWLTTVFRHQYELVNGEPRTVVDELIAEGWIHPDDPLPVCGESWRPPRHNTRVVCLERKGHEGNHREGGFSWDGKTE